MFLHGYLKFVIGFALHFMHSECVYSSYVLCVCFEVIAIEKKKNSGEDEDEILQGFSDESRMN